MQTGSSAVGRGFGGPIAEDGLILRTTVGSVVHGLSNPGADDRGEMKNTNSTSTMLVTNVGTHPPTSEATGT